ncbi:MAG: glycosyltransferase family 4 protein, partial [Gammaproteobacteria bacterium]|nr:glycosyltransferase family 4 protein [Gammaproteobacteria bacterium]
FAESLACGTPVISSPRGALPEIVRQGIDGFLVNSIDEGVLAVSKLDSIDRKNCRMRVEEKFTVDVICDAYETLYRSMIK